MAAITSDITDRVAAVIGDTLNGWFQPHLNFDPIVVCQRYDDWYDEDYLEAWIVWEGDYAYMDHSRTNTSVPVRRTRAGRVGYLPAPPPSLHRQMGMGAE